MNKNFAVLHAILKGYIHLTDSPGKCAGNN